MDVCRIKSASSGLCMRERMSRIMSQKCESIGSPWFARFDGPNDTFLKRTSMLAPYALFARQRRVVIEQLGHHPLQVLVVLIRIFLQVDCLGGISAPDQLFSFGIVEVHHDCSDGNRGSLALKGTVPQAAVASASPTRSEQIDAHFLVDGGVVDHLKVPILFDFGEPFLCKLFVD